MFGSLGKEVITMVKDNPEIGKVIAAGGAGILDGFFSYSLLLLAGVATAFTVSSVLRIRAEEDAGHAESVLSTGLSRTRWVLGSLTVTVSATVLNLFLIGAGMGAAHGLIGGDWTAFWSLVGGSVGMLPGVLLIAGVAVLLLGWLPRWGVLAWALFGFALLQAYLGDLLRFPDALSGVSPFWHLPRVPAEQFAAAPGLVILLLALGLCIVGVLGVRRRDIG
jgi:ABC-2 type transport system permease protein